MITPRVMALATASLLLSCVAFSAEPGAKGKKFPSEAKFLTAPESGLQVVQLTSNIADDSGLYFTSNSFVPSMHGLVFTSKRSGAWNLYLMNLDTYEFVQLTDGKKVGGTGADVCAATKEVFYRDGQLVKSVNLETLKEREITTMPAGYSGGSSVSVTLAGNALAFSICENIPITTKTAVLYSDMDERFEKRPWSAVMTGKTDGTGWHEVARQKKWISHTLISPTNPELVLYCHEGKWQRVEQRMWLASTDGSSNKPLRPEEKSEVAIGHEYWMMDGLHVGYQVQVPGGPKSLGIADVRDGSFHEYATPYRDGHTQASHAGSLFVGDGSEKEPFISLYELKDGQLTGRHLFRHGSSFSQQYWHPHPSFAPDDSTILFTSNRNGNGDVYLIKLK